MKTYEFYIPFSDLLKIDHPLETEPLTSEQIDVLLEKHSLKQEVLNSD